MFEHSEQINDLGAALCKAQSALHHATKDARNPYFDSTYATLASVWDACREALTGNGISVAQSPEQSEKGLLLRTTLIHSTGQWMSSVIPLCGELKNMQQLGSALSYARRYGLSSMVGVCPADDDDGNEASGRTEQRPQAKQPVAKTPRQSELSAQPTADEAWAIKVGEMLDAREFEVNAKARAKAMILRKYKVGGLSSVPADKRVDVEAAINDGKLDQYKQNGTAKQPAAA